MPLTPPFLQLNAVNLAVFVVQRHSRRFFPCSTQYTTLSPPFFGIKRRESSVFFGFSAETIKIAFSQVKLKLKAEAIRSWRIVFFFQHLSEQNFGSRSLYFGRRQSLSTLTIKGDLKSCRSKMTNC